MAPAGDDPPGEGLVTARFVAFDPPAVIRQLGFAHAVWLDDVASIASRAPAIETASVAAPEWFGRAVASRQRGYVAGRHCAGQALARLGSSVALEVIPTGEFGAPQWPAGVTGSITHSVRCAVAVVALREQYRSVGIDCEPIIDAATAASVAERIVPEQRDIVWLGDQRSMPSFEETLTIGFAAKESIYKCLNPVVQEFFGFEAVQLRSIDLARGTAHFTAERSLGEAITAGAPLTVRFSLEHGQVFAASSLAAG